MFNPSVFVAKSTRVPQDKDHYTIANEPGNSATETARHSDRTGVSPSAWKEAPPVIKPASISPKPVYEQKRITPEITNDPYTTPDDPGKSVAQPPYITTTSREPTFMPKEERQPVIHHGKYGTLATLMPPKREPKITHKMRIHTNPPGASVSLNGEFMGKTGEKALIIDGLNPDKYSIKAEKEGYTPAGCEISLVKSQTLFIPLNKRPIPKRHILVETIPVGADVYVDSILCGKTGEEGLKIEKLTPEVHFLTIKKKPHFKTVEVKLSLEDKSKVVKIRMKPLK